MNLEKVKDHVLAELKADKKKAGLLGCLLVVAVIVLARMLLSGSPASASAAPAASPAPAAAASTTAQPAIKSESLSVSDLATKQRREQYLQTMDHKITRDLFAPNTDYFPPEQVQDLTTVTPAAGNQTPEQKDNRTVVEAQARSLALQSTMLATTPTAIINGRVLKKGDWIGGFEVSDIASHSCTVKKDGVTLTLEMSN